jgi:hypothetical protein
MFLRILRSVEITCYAFVFAILLSSSTLLAPRNATERVRLYTRSIEFDYFDWTLNAFGVKLVQGALDAPYYFDADTRHRLVSDAMELTGKIMQDEYQLQMIYTDPQVKDPATASSSLRAKLSQLKRRQAQLLPIAEAILQEQVGAAVRSMGLTTGGQPIPPVLFHITPLPYNLIVSQRDKIEAITSISLLAELSVDQQVALEAQVDKGMKVSSLVVPVGGVGSYPTMVQSTTDLNWLTDTIAHEWIHNWLTLRPLGLNYDVSAELRTMNETTASIAGQEIGAFVLTRYYPELAQALLTQPSAISLPRGHIDANDLRQTFDYRAEMHTTRVHADELLAEGKIDEAEAYMEQRRQFFWDNGYAIRKINQAFFAFYGSYAEAPGGAAGEDPVGPAVRQLRAQSATLGDFLRRIAQMTSFEQLLQAVGR